MTMLDLGFWGIYASSVAVIAWGGNGVRIFLAQHSGIGNPADLNRYKTLVRRQMYLALLMIALLIAGFSTGIALVAEKRLVGLAYVVLANAGVAGVALAHRNLEKRARNLPTTTPELEAEYRRVSESWVKKALPDF
jgi:uncharacterized membrane protein